MDLYLCADGKSMPTMHPCGKAAKALDDAGIEYQIKTVRGGLLKPWTWPSRGRDRAEVKQLSGKSGVPILVLDDGTVVSGSGPIVKWAREHAPSATA
jgi:glutathione S-transferase